MRRLARLVAYFSVGSCLLGGAPAVTADEAGRLTKELIILTEKYRSAPPDARPELLADLRTLVEKRMTTFKTVLDTDPETLLEEPLPDSAYALLPRELQERVEHPLTVEGTIEKQPGGSAQSPYRLRDRQGRLFHLIAVGKVTPFVNGATARVSGICLGDQLIFRGASLTPLSRSPSDTQAPTVAITTPARGATIHDVVTISVSAEDNQRLAQVELLKDGALLGAKEACPCEFSWNTAKEADGPHTLVARAHDVDLNLAVTPPVMVLVDNTPPRVRLSSPLPHQSGSGKLQLIAEADDAIGLETVKFLVDGIVVGVAVSPPYTFTWNTETTFNGLHSLEALAVDRAKNTTTSEAVEMRILNANHVPILDPIGPQTIQESLSLRLTVTAHDPDGERDPLTFTATNLPPWGAFDTATHTFSGTPDFTEASLEQPTKIYSGVRFEVCDGQPLCSHEEIAITVTNVNRPPVMEPLAKQRIREGQPLAVSPVITDPDQDTLTCNAENLPRWLELDPQTCVVRGTPKFGLLAPHEDVRNYPPAAITVCDPDHVCDTQSMAVQVTNVRRNPILARIGDKQTEEGKPLSFTVQATDPDGERLIVTAIGLPTHADFTDRGNGAGFFQWTPAFDQAGSYQVTLKTVKTTDDTLDDEETITITVREALLSISGHILTDDHKPFSNATVEISKSGTLIQQVQPNAKGYYFATHLAPGHYIVRAIKRTVNAPTATVTHFSPLSRSIELTNTDEAGTDFTALVETH